MIKLNSNEYTNSLISIGNILTSLGQITSLLLSKDGRLITGSSDGIIQIINITNYLIDISITASSIGGVYNLSQLDNGHILAGVIPGKIKFYEIKDNSCKLVSILKAHEWKIKSVVPLQNSMFITCSFEAKLKLWDNTSLKKEFGDNNIFVSMIKLRKQNVLVCSECTYNELYRNKENYKIVFYSLDNFDIVHQILKIEKNHKNGLKETNNNKLIIIGEHVITIVNSIHYQIELKIQLNESNNNMKIFVELDNNNFIFGKDNNICLFNLSSVNKVNIKENAHLSKIKCLISIGAQIIVSGSADRRVKFWKLPKNLN